MLRSLPALLLATSAYAAPTLRVEPANYAAEIDEVFELSLFVDDEVGDLSCFAITLAFDDQLLEYVGSAQGALYASSPDPTFFQHSLDGSGDDVFSDCVLGFGTSVLAPGELVRVSLRAIDPGSTPITIVAAALRDVDRALIPGVVFEHGNVSTTVTTLPPLRPGGVLLLAGPNPSAGPVWLRGSGALPQSPLALRIVDASGRLVRQFQPEPNALVGTGLRWDGRDAQGVPVAAGAYFAQLRDPRGLLASTKILRVN